MIKAVHVPGIDNSKTDALSRMPSQDVFDNIQSNLLFSLTIVCFASRLNNKFPILFLMEP